MTLINLYTGSALTNWWAAQLLVPVLLELDETTGWRCWTTRASLLPSGTPSWRQCQGRFHSQAPSHCLSVLAVSTEGKLRQQMEQEGWVSLLAQKLPHHAQKIPKFKHPEVFRYIRKCEHRSIFQRNIIYTYTYTHTAVQNSEHAWNEKGCSSVLSLRFYISSNYSSCCLPLQIPLREVL
jgi:hypothetical protein